MYGSALVMMNWINLERLVENMTREFVILTIARGLRRYQ